MSGGSQHNPNGRQSQLGPGWSPLQLQVANFLARAPQVHMAPDRGVTWHTPTPPPHLYHVPAPSPPDPLQAMKNAGANSVFRHTATPPELYRHTPTPPDKHLMRHTPSPGDMKASAALPPADLYPHLGTARDKLVRAEELLAYARVGVDLSLSSSRSANGSASSPAPSVGGSHPVPSVGGSHPVPSVGGSHPAPPGGAAHPSPALSVRDAPTINSLIARAAPRHPHTRVDALLERLGPSPVSPHSVIVHSRAAPTPSPPSSNEDSADSCGAPPGSKRKRKPERVVRVPSAPPPPAPSEPAARVIALPPPTLAAPSPPPEKPQTPIPTPTPTPPAAPVENGDVVHAKLNGPEQSPPSPAPHSRRKTRSGSAETIADIAAMIADTGPQQPAPPLPVPPPPPIDAAAAVATLESVLASPEPIVDAVEPTPVKSDASPTKDEQAQDPVSAPQAAAPRRRSARTSNSEATNVPVESPSEAKPAEPEASEARSAEPTAASFVEVENQLEKMFAGLEEEPSNAEVTDHRVPEPRKRRRSAPARGDRSARGRDDRRKAQRKKDVGRARKLPKEPVVKDAYDSGSNASSSRSRGPYIQIRGARDSPVSVSVMNSWTGEEEVEGVRRKAEDFSGARRARGLHASTLGLRYDATTPDATWLCAFCQTGPHAHALGDLFGPYTLDTDCEEYRSLEEATRRRYTTENSHEVWFHEACAVWAPGLVAAGARVWGLASAVWGARGARCGACGRAGAALACSARGCRARTHLPCASCGDVASRWTLRDDTYNATCPRHAQAPA